MIPALAVGIALFFAASGWLLILLTLFTNGANPATSLLGPAALLGALPVALFAAWQIARFASPPRATHWWHYTVFFLGLLVLLRLSLWSSFLFQDQIHLLLPNNLGDFALHAGQTAHLAQNHRLPTTAQILADAPFAYPFGINWIAAVCARVGFPIPQTLTLTLTLAAIGLAAAAWTWSRPFGIPLLLLNGGIAGFAILFTHSLVNFQDSLAWKSIPLAMLGTQRGLVVGLTIGLLLLAHFRWLFSEPRRHRPGLRLPAWCVVPLIGILPLYHLHTFAALALIGGVATLFAWRRLQPAALIPPILGGLAALPLVWWVTGGFALGRQGDWAVGWWLSTPSAFFAETYQNLGFWLVLFLAIPLAVLVPKARRTFIQARLWGLHRGDGLLALLPGAALLALLCALYRFQPWDWDNTKFFIWAWLVLGTVATEGFIRRAPFFIRIPTLVLLFFSGTVSLLAGLHSQPFGYSLITRPELTAVGEALTHLDPAERFVCHSPVEYQHPLLLHGANVAAGYEGHLFSHGYAYQEQLAANHAILAGASDWEFQAAKIGATLAFWGPRERAAYPGPPPPWAIMQNLVIAAPGFAIYRLQPLQHPTNQRFQQFYR